MKINLSAAMPMFALPLLALTTFAAANAQVPSPNPSPSVAPRAAWRLTPGVTGTPTQRRDNPGAASQDKLYMFGGRLGNATATVLNALYEFNGSAWTLRTAEGAVGSPPARGGACVAWDPSGTGSLIVFGGDDGAGTLFGDTWSWDPTNNTWTQIQSVVAPSARRFSAMTYEPVTGGMLLFGGETATAPVVQTNDTWLLLSGQWLPMSPSTRPPARRMHSTVTRSDFGDVLMCAGMDASVTPNLKMLDVWTWDGADWSMITPTTTAVPAGTNANQAVYDPLRRRVVMQGGQGISTGTTLYGTEYGGSPTTWCSEFDCVTNEWLLFGQAGFNTGDPAIGRASRYYAGFIPALGKVFKAGGQNPSGVGTISGTCDYQATPVAGSTPFGAGCLNSASTLVSLAPTTPSDRPWLGRTFQYTTTGLLPGSVAASLLGFATTSLPLNLVFPSPAGCELLVDSIVATPVTSAAPTLSLALPVSTGIFAFPIHIQTLQIEVSGPSISAVNASNGMTLTLGAL